MRQHSSDSSDSDASLPAPPRARPHSRRTFSLYDLREQPWETFLMTVDRRSNSASSPLNTVQPLPVQVLDRTSSFDVFYCHNGSTFRLRGTPNPLHHVPVIRYRNQGRYPRVPNNDHRHFDTDEEDENVPGPSRNPDFGEHLPRHSPQRGHRRYHGFGAQPGTSRGGHHGPDMEPLVDGDSGSSEDRAQARRDAREARRVANRNRNRFRSRSRSRNRSRSRTRSRSRNRSRSGSRSGSGSPSYQNDQHFYHLYNHFG